MAETYIVRGKTKGFVALQLERVVLQKAHDQYTFDDAAAYVIALKRVATGIYNPQDAKFGMSRLLISSTDPTTPSAISAIRSTDIATAQSVIIASKREAATRTPTTDPDISDRQDAEAAAEKLNINYQSIIGAKEAIAEAITMQAGTDITDPVLRTPDGSDFKTVDEFEIFELINAVMNGADRPRPIDILAQYTAVLQFQFVWQDKVRRNAEVLSTRAGRLSAFGLTIDAAQRATVILANLDRAAGEEWGSDFRPVVQKIRAKYPYNHTFDDAAIEYILAECAKADSVRRLRDAPGRHNADPTPIGTANSVSSAISHLQNLVLGDDTEDDTSVEGYSYGTAYASRKLTYDSDSSDDRPRRRTNKHKSKDRDDRRSKSRDRRKSSSRDKGRRESSDDEKPDWRDNPCPHCKKHKRFRQHPWLDPAECHWNRKYTGYRPEGICEKLGIPFRSRSRFDKPKRAAKRADPSDSE